MIVKNKGTKTEQNKVLMEKVANTMSDIEQCNGFPVGNVGSM